MAAFTQIASYAEATYLLCAEAACQKQQLGFMPSIMSVSGLSRSMSAFTHPALGGSSVSALHLGFMLKHHVRLVL